MERPRASLHGDDSDHQRSRVIPSRLNSVYLLRTDQNSNIIVLNYIFGGSIVGRSIVGGSIVGGKLSGGQLSGGQLSGGQLSGGQLSGGQLSGSIVGGSIVAVPINIYILFDCEVP